MRNLTQKHAIQIHLKLHKYFLQIEKPFLRTKFQTLLNMRPDYSSNTYFKMMVNIAMKYQIPFEKAVKELTPMLQFEIEIAKVTIKSIFIFFIISLHSDHLIFSDI